MIVKLIQGFVFLTFFVIGSTAQAQMSEAPQDEKPIGYWNWSTKTMGGRQFWTDVQNLADWRIQFNHVTGHYRLLDPQNVRQAWGNYPHCQQKLSQFAVSKRLRPYSGKVVILLHGLVRSHASMLNLSDHLRKNGYQTVNFQYASSRSNISNHARALENIVAQLGDDVTEINFVGHSLGNLVVRHYLNNTRDPVTGAEGDPRIGRMVMLGPPNQGSHMARLMKYSMIFNVVTGPSGTQLSSTWEELEPLLAQPKFEFGIIAGGQEEGAALSNYLLNGPDDFTVSVEETRLEGAADFVVRPMLHGSMMSQPETLDLTLNFLQHGYFTTSEERKPIQPETNK